jgi:hypothetical protein
MFESSSSMKHLKMVNSRTRHSKDKGSIRRSSLRTKGLYKPTIGSKRVKKSVHRKSLVADSQQQMRRSISLTSSKGLRLKSPKSSVGKLGFRTGSKGHSKTRTKSKSKHHDKKIPMSSKPKFRTNLVFPFRSKRSKLN